MWLHQIAFLSFNNMLWKSLSTVERCASLSVGGNLEGENTGSSLHRHLACSSSEGLESEQKASSTRTPLPPPRSHERWLCEGNFSFVCDSSHSQERGVLCWSQKCRHFTRCSWMRLKCEQAFQASPDSDRTAAGSKTHSIRSQREEGMLGCCGFAQMSLPLSAQINNSWAACINRGRVRESPFLLCSSTVDVSTVRY